MTQKKMTVFGVGHKIAIPVFIYLGLAIWLTFRFENWFLFSPSMNSGLWISGIVLCTVGLSMNFVSAFMMMAAYYKERLATKGFYALFKNPMYASFIFFTIPGLALLLNSWLVLTASAVLFITCKIWVKSEEKWLENKFGDEYRTYREKVLIKII